MLSEFQSTGPFLSHCMWVPETSAGGTSPGLHLESTGQSEVLGGKGTVG